MEGQRPDKVLQSAAFEKAERLSDFPRHVVRESLTQRESHLRAPGGRSPPALDSPP